MQLDARQRAMLLEMSVRVWTTPPARPHAAGAFRQVAPADSAATAQAAAQTQEPRAPRTAPAPTASRPSPSAPERVSSVEPMQWHVQAPHLLYPDVDAALTPPELGAGWLVVAETFAAGDPLAEGAERLLANMLHALQLHRHPRVWLCSVGPAGGAAGDDSDAATAIAHHVESLAPSVVLVMGRNAVRAGLARSEPLGKLRGTALTIAGVPAVVTFGAYVLLRSPEFKPAAWADLCRARELAGRGKPVPMP